MNIFPLKAAIILYISSSSFGLNLLKFRVHDVVISLLMKRRRSSFLMVKKLCKRFWIHC